MYGTTFFYTLTISSFSYRRIGGQSSNYYYVTQQLIVSVSGYYSFTSSSSFAAYGFIYSNSFNPSNPSLNLVAQGESDANGQFQFTVFLQVAGQVSKRVCIIFLFYYHVLMILTKILQFIFHYHSLDIL